MTVWLLIKKDCDGSIKTEIFRDANKAKEAFLERVISYTIDATMHNMANEELTGVEDIYKLISFEEHSWYINFGLSNLSIEEKEIK
jgi:hypothetical protein